MRNSFVLAYLLLLVCSVSVGNAYAQENGTSKNKDGFQRVVVLQSYHKGQRWSDDLGRGIESVLNKHTIELNFEYMDTIRFSSESHLDNLAVLLEDKYGQREVDVVIPTDDEALDFLLINRGQIFPAAAIVYCGVIIYVDRFWEPRLTGVIEDIDLTGTVRVAKSLNPELREIFVIMDNTPTSISLINSFIQAIEEFEPDIQFRFSDFVTFEKLLEEVDGLKDDSAVFLVNYTNARDGRVMSTSESVGLITKNSKVPVYSVWDSYMGLGVLGGKLVSGYSHGQKSGEMALRILQGEPVNNIPVLTKVPGQYMFDYNQLQKFSIEESDLPEKSIIINQPDPLYRRYKRMFLTLLVGGASLSIIILLLSINIAYRRKVERSLKRYSDRLNFLHRLDQSILNSFSLDDINEQIFRPTLHRVKCDLVGIHLFEQETVPSWGMALACTSLESPITDFEFQLENLPKQLLDKKSAVTIGPKESGLLQTVFTGNALSKYDSYLLLPLVYKRSLLGIFFLAQENGRSIDLNQKNVSQQIAHTLALAIQNHYLFIELKKHEEKLRHMSSSIIEAQEQERKRISAELHDEFGQSLTAININFSVIRKRINIDENSKIYARMEEVETAIEHLSDQVHNLSLDLRPPMLDDLGLIPTLRWFLNQHGVRSGVDIEFTPVDTGEGDVPDQIAITMYRVMQEALTNISKHANASLVVVFLQISKDTVVLKVKDNGSGFDTNDYKYLEPGKGGLGLLGMQERLDLLDGHMVITSEKNRGTMIEAVAPLK